MCGIVGIFEYSSHIDVSSEKIADATTLLDHRGPDDRQIYCAANFGIGFTRLAIIDFENGAQPMVSPSGRYVLAFNGEIYNYRKLRQQLTQEGYQFRTESECEVILALFESEYASPETYLHGMFAFAIYDTQNKQLVLSRDRLGKKPLFYTDSTANIAFASELKALQKVSGIPSEANLNVISDLLTYGYNPSDHGALAKTKEVPAGYRIVITDSTINKERWWQLPQKTCTQLAASRNIQNEIIATLRTAVQSRLISDAPIGIFLSGGLDSSLILALAAEGELPPGFTAYTIGYDNKQFDETTEARELATEFGVLHKTVLMHPQDFEKAFDDAVYKSDNLLSNPAMFANYMLSSVVSNEVKSVLHGGGGDELFFGYDTYRADTISHWLNIIPQQGWSAINKVANAIPASHGALGFQYKAAKFSEAMQFGPLKRHFWWRTIFTENEKQNLLRLNHAHDSYMHYKSAYDQSDNIDFFDTVAFADMKVWWQKMGLYQGDCMSMANSLELRMPFMDHRLIELLATIPRKTKFGGWTTKKLFKNICRNYLPENLVKKPKRGFHLPLASWFAGPLQPFVEQKLSHERISELEFLDDTTVQNVLAEHYSRRQNNSFKIVNLLVLVEWYHRFILSSTASTVKK